MRQTISLTELKSTSAGKRSDNQHLFEDKVKQKRQKRKVSPNVEWLQEELEKWCKERGYNLKTERRFHEHRKFKFDFSIKEIMIAIEYEGGIWLKGGGAHSRPASIERDILKYNLAQELGWKVIRVHSKNYREITSILRGIIKNIS